MKKAEGFVSISGGRNSENGKVKTESGNVSFIFNPSSLICHPAVCDA